ncbi:right-handed parallel beta-helix repeat-containing protein [Pelagibius sp. Alg239-R121]|uniref:right-handed parallel beta-helix repeat-containing protein n=1 Tax=Pelagibius sp. Alg239-R121 TaxID=2993448 RepID=UPI0024A64FC0|nr:right-handed parallel beta-helix repeat-containing protein [Pelagibius sp. Alg239-R121]
MRPFGPSRIAVVSGVLIAGLVGVTAAGHADAPGVTFQIAELPTGGNWKSGTIRRGSDGNPTIEKDGSGEPRIQVPPPRNKIEQLPVENIKNLGAKKTSARKAVPPPKPVQVPKAAQAPKTIQAPKLKQAEKPARAAKTEIAQAKPGSAQFAVQQAAMPGLAKIVADLKPGSWYQVPNTEIRQVLASRDMAPENGGVSGPGSVVRAWNGATFDGRFWYFHGGGHKDYSGNEVYAFDFVDLSWARLTDPSPFVYKNPETGKWDAPKSRKHPCPRVPDLDGDGKFDAPVPGHTYDSIVYSPKTESFFLWSQVPFCIGGNGWSGAPVWEFNPKTKSWTGHRPDNGKDIEGYKSAELDPATGNILLVSRYRLSIFDVERKQYTTMRKVRNTGSDGTAAVDPVRRLLVLSDRAGVRSAKLGDGSSVGGLENKTTRPAFNQTAGVAYNSRDKNLVYWSGDRRVFTLDPVSNEWGLYENHGGRAPKRSRPYSKFVYIDALDVYAAYSNPNQGIWLYRLPKEKPVPDPNRVVSLCHGESCQKFRYIGKAFREAKDGAVITIGGATFYESAILKANNVTVRGSKGTHLLETTAEGKATLVIKGNNTTIEGIECSGIGVSDGNGACIRLEGDNLVLRNVYFHDSQQGLLTKSKGGGSILVEDSKFERLGGACGIKCGRAHGIYIGRATELTVRNSVFLSAKDEGHAIKSRAAKTTIENNVIASLDGKDSRLIDIPNGGTVVIRNNVLQEGSKSSNPDIIGIGLELAYKGIKGFPVNSSLITGNKVVIEPAKRPRSFVHSRDVPDPEVKENIIIGGAKPGSENKWYKTREEAGLGPYPELPKIN